MSRRLVVLASLLLGMACSSDSNEDSAASMPVASSWNGQSAAKQSGQPESDRHAGRHMGAEDRHAGLDMGAPDPHAGLNMGAGDPHAGVDMAGGDPHAGLDMAGGDPHAGLDMSGAGSTLGGLEPPDPNRKIDSNMFLKGSLTASKATAGLIRPGSIVFISVRPVHKATGESLGSPLAVERLEVQSLPVRFHLSAEQSMVAGTAFEGDVMVYARMDGDGEASTTIAGDVEGSVMATIPAEGLELVLDTVVGAK